MSHRELDDAEIAEAILTIVCPNGFSGAIVEAKLGRTNEEVAAAVRARRAAAGFTDPS